LCLDGAYHAEAETNLKTPEQTAARSFRFVSDWGRCLRHPAIVSQLSLTVRQIDDRSASPHSGEGNFFSEVTRYVS
jgi:hypothetical protein